MSESKVDLYNKKVLFSPLNWGWGHCTRSIALLRLLQEQGNQIWIATNPRFRSVYETYLEGIHFLNLEDYPFQFGDKGEFLKDLLKSALGLRKVYRNEKKLVDKWVSEYSIDVVLSDHRLGFLSSRVRSVLISHQLNLQHPYFSFVLNGIHLKMVNRFHEVWIPDDADRTLSGKLSMAELKVPIKCIGYLSRFQGESGISTAVGSDLLIVSGPEPHAFKLYEEVVNRYVESQKSLKVVYVGLNTEGRYEASNIHHVEADSWLQLDREIVAARKVISRSGYSTIMDLNVLNKPSELIATPGQGEQVYLAKRHKKSSQ